MALAEDSRALGVEAAEVIVAASTCLIFSPNHKVPLSRPRPSSYGGPKPVDMWKKQGLSEKLLGRASIEGPLCGLRWVVAEIRQAFLVNGLPKIARSFHPRIFVCD